MITTNDKKIALVMRSLRDWGKVYGWDSYLGDHTTRYSQMVGNIKYFKHYTYETVGYNAKLPEANAAFGRVQLKRLDKFVEGRRDNRDYLNEQLSGLKDVFVPIEMVPNAEPSWFGYSLTFKDTHMDRNKFGDHLEDSGIRTRPFFAGNITRHKPFLQYLRQYAVADKLMNDSLFIGIWQGINRVELDYMINKILDYVG